MQVGEGAVGVFAALVRAPRHAARLPLQARAAARGHALRSQQGNATIQHNQLPKHTLIILYSLQLHNAQASSSR